jgi:hypothetical protein
MDGIRVQVSWWGSGHPQRPRSRVEGLSHCSRCPRRRRRTSLAGNATVRESEPAWRCSRAREGGCTGLEILDAGAWRRGQEDWLPRRRASEPGCRRETTRLGRVWELPPRASEPVRRRSDDTSWLWEAGSAWEAAHHWRWHRVMAQSLARSTWRRGMPSSAAGAPSHRSNVYAPCPDGAELGDAFLHGVVLAQHHHIWHWARPFLTSGN